MTNRRQFFGTLGKALGASGLLLPWAGRGALALPADLGKAAQLPVTAASLPFSKEALRLREIRRELHAIHLKGRGDVYGEGENTQAHKYDRWRSLMVEHYCPIAHKITARQAPTWADCVELAEIIWQSLPKEDRLCSSPEDPTWEYLEPTGALSVAADDTRMGDSAFTSGAYHCRHAIVALVEAVLTLGNGERRDPQTEEGYWPQRVRRQDPANLRAMMIRYRQGAAS